MHNDLPFCYLTTTGRRTGRPHAIEIWFARSGPTIYLLAGGGEGSDWVRNLMEEPSVVVRVGDKDGRGRARLLSVGSDEDAEARRLLLRKYRQPGDQSLNE